MNAAGEDCIVKTVEKRKLLVQPRADAPKTSFPVVGRWHWLDAAGKVHEKVVEWQWPFNQEMYLERFFQATLVGEYKDLPKYDEIFAGTTNSFDFGTKVLGISPLEYKQMTSLTLEGLENNWAYNIFERYWVCNNLRDVHDCY